MDAWRLSGGKTSGSRGCPEFSPEKRHVEVTGATKHHQGRPWPSRGVYFRPSIVTGVSCFQDIDRIDKCPEKRNKGMKRASRITVREMINVVDIFPSKKEMKWDEMFSLSEEKKNFVESLLIVVHSRSISKNTLVDRNILQILLIVWFMYYHYLKLLYICTIFV